MADLFDTFQPASLRVSLDGTMRDIEARLLPSGEHYRVIRSEHPDVVLDEFDIQRSILLSWTRDRYGKPDRFGIHWHQHLLMFMKLLMPETIITPSFVDLAIATEIALEEHRDLVNMIGAKSTGKSAYMARIGLTLVALDPGYTRCYVAAPFKNVADFTIWSEIQSCFAEIKRHHGDIYPEARETPSAKLIQLDITHAKGGRLDLIGLDNVGKLQGTKSRNAERGFMVLLGDEIALFPTQDFVQVLDNITGNKNFIGFDGCNFKSPLGMDGILCSPEGMEYTDLDPDTHHIWRSGYNSLTIRLDGHLSPNVLTDREIYPFLLNERKRANMEAQHGKQGPKYLEQIRSFPHHGVEDQFLLTMERLRSGGAYDKFWNRDSQPWTRVAFCDPGWGGDPCKIIGLEFGPARLQAHDGSVVMTNIIRPIGPIETIKVDANMMADIDFLRRLTEISEGPVMLKEGRMVTMDLQIAVQCGEFLRKYGIPRSNFGYDSSCRGSIAQEMATVLGPQVKVYDFVNVATEMVVASDGATARERYRNLRSESYFTLQLIVASGQLKDADVIPDAIMQACRHRVVQAGMKQALESKSDYKKVNQGKSPDSSDCLAGGCHLARRCGFMLSFDRSGASVSVAIPFDFANIRPRPRLPNLRT